MIFKHICNAVYIYKTYLQIPITIFKPDKCYSLKTLLSKPYLFDNDIMPILDCTCSYTCRYKQNGKPAFKYKALQIHKNGGVVRIRNDQIW